MIKNFLEFQRKICHPEELKETSNELYIIFALALLTAYLVMAATFNSFVHPFIIILTVPLAIFGGLVFILFLNTSINIFSQIALVILIGISTKNSILIVDYANQIRTTGKNIEVAVKEACNIRFRPIIMTSLSTMIAMLPLVIGNFGPGAGQSGQANTGGGAGGSGDGAGGSYATGGSGVVIIRVLTSLL